MHSLADFVNSTPMARRVGAVHISIASCSFVVALTCKHCLQECSVVGSKELKGGDPSVREEDKRIAIRRRFERRVRDRLKGTPFDISGRSF